MRMISLLLRRLSALTLLDPVAPVQECLTVTAKQMARWNLAFLLLFSSSNAAYAQVGAVSPSAGKLTVTPPSPTVAALERAGSIPVSYYTGLPNVSVPLYTIHSGTVTLPIALSYHASGLRVDDPGGWTGVGWSLAVGGTISRTVHGRPDEEAQSGYWDIIRQAKDLGALPCRPGRAKHLLFAQCTSGEYDLEPDVFSYSFGGYSGSFVIDTLGRKVLMPFQALRIEGGKLNSFGGLTPFTITTEDGTRYIFDEEEITTFNEGSYTSSWHLTRVIPLHGSAVSLTYSSESVVTRHSSTETQSEETVTGCNGLPITTRSVSSSSVDIGTKTVQSITWPTGQLQFFASPRRANGTKLDSVHALDAQRVVVRRFRLSYFEGTRLLLTRAQELASGGTSTKPPYRFFYDSFDAPYNTFAVPYASLGYDHWGVL